MTEDCELNPPPQSRSGMEELIKLPEGHTVRDIYVRPEGVSCTVEKPDGELYLLDVGTMIKNQRAGTDS